MVQDILDICLLHWKDIMMKRFNATRHHASVCIAVYCHAHILNIRLPCQSLIHVEVKTTYLVVPAARLRTRVGARTGDCSAECACQEVAQCGTANRRRPQLYWQRRHLRRNLRS